MLYVVIAFLFLAIVLYFLLGGADFGAGIIELFTSEKNRQQTRKTMYQAIGPIWEANHMWLIIAVVILFVGFPVIYSQMCTYLHIPLLVMLMEITARGTAFAFRSYDAVKGERTQNLYNHIFVYSSFITPLFLGIIAGSAISRQIDLHPASFVAGYIFSWLNYFSVAVGLFTVALSGYLAAIYLIGEADDDKDAKRFIKKAKYMNIIAVIFGGMVFIAAGFENVRLAHWIFGNSVSLTAVIAATISLILLWVLISRGKKKIIRIFAGFQVTMILLAVGYMHYPYFIMIKGGQNLSLMSLHAPNKTIDDLGWALFIGSFLILPSLFYLYYSFQKKNDVV
ncbi:cytochrome d ubiquinol oxidase subunit II [Mucilaginibacter gotjawali]|uniref:Cytochrome d ubiquinol oxidase subunit II n=2 Tax=Mucilaginibacter gotjawali TaxID=1550579 RepID=A0A839S8G8_9SPHI|nr:cytochrome d ubiquinol oxidase subunit II [Mucilaginibacter gotjawali]MBB3054096.1 cytochrome d ubiquinol oxidase subunit II [Mucilaginibacter gotjawali]BAU54365.1 Cytochrome bd-I ubiquinol oxidase subunit 2 [Mucilaginibacter gotjawali]